MKKSFTLKAAALGLAVVTAFGASAARPQLAARSLAPKKVVQLNTAKTRTAQTMATNNGAEAYSEFASHRFTPAFQNFDLTQQPVSRAFNPYGAWEDAGTLTYTFTNLFDGKGVDKTYSYQKRVNRNNAENFQIKVANWGAFTAAEAGIELPGVELVLTVTPMTDSDTKETKYVVTTSNAETLANEGIALGWQIGITDTQSTEAYFYDHYTWAQAVSKVNTNWTQEAVESWFASSIYDPQSGKFEIMPIYAGTGADVRYALQYGELNAAGTNYAKYWYDYIQLSGKFYNYDYSIDTEASYFYRNAGETGGHYKGHYTLNDNAVGMVKILPGQLEQNAVQAAFNDMVDAMNAPTSDMAVFSDTEGWFDLEVSDYKDDAYTLLYGIGKGGDDQGNININGGYYVVYNDGAEYVQDGFAKYNDVIIPAFISMIELDDKPLTPEDFGFSSKYTTTCQVEKSEKTAGLYRLRAPYAEYPGNNELLNYDQTLDYLYYSIADPSKALVDYCFTGHYTGQGANRIYVTYGSGHLVLDDAKQQLFGSYADNKLTFPSTTYTQEFGFVDNNNQTFMKPITMGALLAVQATIGQNNQGQSVIYFNNWISPAKPADFLIETGAVDAIENVEAEGAADANAPVEYFNLQGQKVLNPAAGQLVIKKQGSKVTKIIAQ